MSQSITDICNSALQRVGAARITDLSDNSREARACAVAYDSNRRSELRKNRWKFAMKRAVLAANATTPAFDFDYAFDLPSDCLRIIIPKDPTLDWVHEGNQILTNLISSPMLTDGPASTATGPVLYLRYVSDIEDVTLFDPLFYDACCIALAIDVVEVLTNSNAKKQNLLQEYKDTIADAKKANALEQIPTDAVDDDWWLARVR